MAAIHNTTHTEAHRIIPLKQYIFVACLIAFSSLCPVHAGHKVVVVPLLGDAATRPAQVVIVAKSGGDFADPLAAVNSITDASETRPYVVYIAPGVYNLSDTLQLKPHVRVNGSGVGITVLRGAIGAAMPSADAALINGADNAVISSLSLINDGASNISIGVYMNGSSPTLDDVHVELTSGSAAAFGAYVKTANPSIINSLIDARSSSTAGTNIYGLALVNAQGSYKNLTITADGADQFLNGRAAKAFALVAENTRIALSNIRLTALDASVMHVVYAIEDSFLTVDDNSGLFTPGVHINAKDTSTVVIKHSNFIDTPGVLVAPSASVVCLFSTEGQLNTLNSNCD